MKSKNSLRHKLHRVTYDNPKLNRHIVDLRQSMDEISQILNGKDNSEKPRK